MTWFAGGTGKLGRLSDRHASRYSYTNEICQRWRAEIRTCRREKIPLKLTQGLTTGNPCLPVRRSLIDEWQERPMSGSSPISHVSNNVRDISANYRVPSQSALTKSIHRRNTRRHSRSHVRLAQVIDQQTCRHRQGGIGADAKLEHPFGPGFVEIDALDRQHVGVAPGHGGR